jgi:signal transduction histidine kinase
MSRGQIAAYVALLGACLVVSVAGAWTAVGRQFDNGFYDFLLRAQPPPGGEAASIVLGIDEKTLRATRGGIRGIRTILADTLPRVARAGPRAVAVDVVLADPGASDAEDATLAAAFASVPKLVLAADLAGGEWEDPVAEFRKSAAAVGHVHSDPDPHDNVVRRVALEKAPANSMRRLFALSLEAFRLTHCAEIVESPGGFDLCGRFLPSRREQRRPLLVRYRPLPVVTAHELANDLAAAARLAGKAVFVGVTAQTAAQDRHATPLAFGGTMPGVEINANAYETLVGGSYLRPVSNTFEAGVCLALAAAAGAIFVRFSGWQAYALALAALVSVHAAPFAAFRAGFVLPYSPMLSAAWLSMVGAASFQHFVVRRQLRQSEAAKQRYQQAIHFVAHEMKTPLTTIQGSSELMGRYKLSDDKRAELARSINAESKRLGHIIRTFLDVERLGEGQLELRREPFDVRALVEASVERALPLADRKQIRLVAGELAPATILGDHELMEYAVYNLVNNAIKYSPAETVVTVSGQASEGRYRLAVRDQGIGMDEQELGSIFRKFYRTRRAEASGESGTGIGLSIVEQIVTHHGGRMEVSSAPGKGSCFTMVVPTA